MKYTVKAGDTLSHIAKKYNTTVAALVAANGLKDPDFLYIDQTLTIPATGTQGTGSPDEIRRTLKNCLAAIETMPEFRELEKMLDG